MARTSTVLTNNEILTIQAIVDGTYFHRAESLTGTQNGVNVTFILSSTPNPATSLELKLNGQDLTLTTDYSLSGAIITFVQAPFDIDIIKAWYVVSPV